MQSTTQRPVLFAAAGLLVIGALAAGIWLSADEPAAVTASPTAAAATAEKPAPAVDATQRTALPRTLATGVYGAPAGSTFRYQLTDAGEYSVLERDGGQQQTGALRVEATLVVQVLARSDEEILVRANLPEITFTGAGDKPLQDDPLAQSFTAAAHSEVLLRLGQDGAVHGYHFAEDLDGDQRNFLRGTLSAFAFTVPVQLPEHWQASEADTSGIYDARYEHLPAQNDADVAVQRQKLHYTTMRGEGELPVHELRGAAVAHFAKDLGWLRSASVDEGMRTALPLLNLSADYHRRAELLLLASSDEPLPAGIEALWSGDWAKAAGHDEVLADHAVAAERRNWQQRLAGVDLQQLMQELQAVFAKQPLDHDALDAVFQQLQWLVKLDAKVAGAIVTQVCAGGLDADQAGVLLSALAAAGTDAAQQALLAVRSNGALSADIRDAATVALFQLARPLGQLVDGLASDAAGSGDGRLGAMLVLGALAPRCDSPLADGRSAMAALLAMEPAASARGELPEWLRALGNAGTQEAVAAAQAHLGDEDVEVRAAACAALRSVEGAAAVSLLCERGLTDASADVRCEAARALGQHSEVAAVAALRHAAANDQEPMVRSAALQALGRDLGNQQNRAVIAQAAASDSDEAVRRLCASMLQGA